MSASLLTGGPAPGPTPIQTIGTVGGLSNSLVITQQQGALQGGAAVTALSLQEPPYATYDSPANQVQTEFFFSTPNITAGGIGAEGAFYLKGANAAVASTIAYAPKPTATVNGADGTKGLYLVGLSQSGTVTTAGGPPATAAIPVAVGNSALVMATPVAQATGVCSVAVAAGVATISSAAAGAVNWFIVHP